MKKIVQDSDEFKRMLSKKDGPDDEPPDDIPPADDEDIPF